MIYGTDRNVGNIVDKNRRAISTSVQNIGILLKLTRAAVRPVFKNIIHTSKTQNYLYSHHTCTGRRIYFYIERMWNRNGQTFAVSYLASINNTKILVSAACFTTRFLYMYLLRYKLIKCYLAFKPACVRLVYKHRWLFFLEASTSSIPVWSILKTDWILPGNFKYG